jgi:hypothetical protein
VQHAQLGEPQPLHLRPETRDEYPLLTLPEQRQSRQTAAPSSLVVERSTGADSNYSRTSIGLPRDRRSQPLDSNMPAVPQEPAPASDYDRPAPVRGPRSNAADPEAAMKPIRPDPSRVSLPSRPHSMHSHRSGTVDGDRADDDDNASEFPWGPAHPCFPHPNPHVPIKSPLYDTTRIIRIKRDWMVKGDLAPTFSYLYPEILVPVFSEDEFRRVMQHINTELLKAFNPLSGRAVFDAIMGMATFWLWDDAGFTSVKRQLKGLENWIEDWNRDVGLKEGVQIIPLRRTGYLTVCSSILSARNAIDMHTARHSNPRPPVRGLAPEYQSG